MSLSESAVKKIAIAATVVALGAAGVALYYRYVLATRAGDEPPIRVKGGSIEMDLIRHANNAHQWHKPNPNDKRKWKISNGHRSTPRYLVYVGANDCSKCTNAEHVVKLVHVGSVVTFVHEDGTEVSFNAAGNSTEVTSQKDLTDSSNQKLTYPTAGRIARILVDGTPVCTFENASELDSVMLTQEP